MAPFIVDEYPPDALSAVTPGVGCYTCGSPKRLTGPAVRHAHGELLISLGVRADVIEDASGIHGFTQPVICEECIIGMAALVGCLHPDRTETLINSNLTQVQRIVDLEEEVAKFEALKSQIQKVRL